LSVTTDVLVGAGFFLLGILATALTVALVVSRRRWSSLIIDHYVRSARNAKPRMRWLWFAWRDPKWDEALYRSRWLPGIWIPVISVPVMLGAVAFGAAFARF
jgi:hypothetical protein